VQHYLDKAIRRHEAGELRAAEHAYRVVLQSDPRNTRALNMLGILVAQKGHWDKGIELFRQALEVDPDFGDAWANLGKALHAIGDYGEAVEVLWASLQKAPDDPTVLEHLIRALRLLEYTDDPPADILEQQQRAYEAQLEAEPGNAEARYMLHALRSDKVMARSPDDFVQVAFDRYAESFEDSLAKLEYRVPELLRQTADRHFPEPGRQLDVLDAGCGTGLCGELLKPRARRMVGVDLSGQMLEIARNKEIYDELHCAELTAWMNGSEDRFDLLACGDTLIYFGELEEVLRAMGGVLRPEGLLVFTVQLLPPGGADWQLTTSGRYSHAASFVAQALQAAGLRSLWVDEVVLRQEGGKPVKGLLVAAEVGGNQSASAGA